MRISAIAVALCFGVVSGVPQLSAADFIGTIRSEAGQPLVGAMFTLWNEEHTRKLTVYTDSRGRYALRTDFGGTLDVRARIVNFADTLTEITVSKDGLARLDLVVKHFENAEDRTYALAASAHASELKWDTKGHRSAFISQCNYCHQVGNELTRVPRDAEDWKVTVNRMEGYFAAISADDNAAIVKSFTEGFDGRTIDKTHSYGASELLANAKIEQWLVGDGMSFLHDTDVGSDGKLYGTDEGHDVIWVLDRETHEIDQIEIPSIGLPVGGVFSGMSLPIGLFVGEHGPHSMAETSDHKLWFTNSLSVTLGELDLKTRGVKLHPIKGDALYPHTIRAAKDDTLWFTVNASNQLGHYDPSTDTMDVYPLPSNGFWRWITDVTMPTILRASSWFERMNLPLTISHHKFFGNKVVASAYGIDVHPKDGSIWLTQLYDNMIVRFDPATKEMKSFATPYKGPRRPRFDKDGILWIPAFDDGVLMRFDPATGVFKNYKLPLLAGDEYEVPYALNVDQATGDVWITANATDRVLRFFPKTETFISYPSPTRVTVLRDLVFTKDGRVCNSTSNLPAYGMEDGVDTFFCIVPNGGADDRKAIEVRLANAH